MRLTAQLVLLTIATVANAGQASRQAAVSKAIEQTKSRLTPAASPLRVPQRANVRLNGDQLTTSSPGKTENLDVEKLNRLIRALDKTWILPKTGAKEPVGSNFQYKKTCASIYKARHGACQQLGFGVMCFNYCHERGEKLAFKCQDTSDSSYCKQSGTFDTFLAKYRKDGYKAKAYIHQMISRCYATTICNTQSGMLNSTIIDEDPEPVEKTTKANRLKLLTRKPGNALSLMKLKTKTTTTTAPEEVPEEEILPEEEEEITTTTRKTRPAKKVVNNTLRQRPTPAPEVTTTKANIWDKFTVGNKGKPTPKYIPFWQRLMSTTSRPTEDEATEESEMQTDAPEEVEEASTQAEVLEKEDQETTPEESEATTIPEEDVVVTKSQVHKTNAEVSESTDSPKRTFKPIPFTVPSTGPELSHQKPNEDVSGPGFWNRFQPNRWFESIHYVTNTGK